MNRLPRLIVALWVISSVSAAESIADSYTSLIEKHYQDTINSCYLVYNENTYQMVVNKQKSAINQRVWLADDIICIRAEDIDKPLAADFESLVKGSTNKVSRIVISSYGGDAEAAMRIGRIVHENKMDIFPWGLCLSSCANYIYLAARDKYYGLYDNAGPVIGFHGSPKFGDQHPITRMHIEYFAWLGLSDGMTDTLPCNLQNDALFHQIQEHVGKTNIVWVFPPQELERGFGVMGQKYDEFFKLQTEPSTWRFIGYAEHKLNSAFIGLASCPEGGAVPRP